MFRVREDEKAPLRTGPEMQVLDNKGHKDDMNPKTSAGSNYALHAPMKDVTKKIGKYNKAKILVKGIMLNTGLTIRKFLNMKLKALNGRN